MFAVIQLPGFQLQAALRHDPGAFAGPAALLAEDPRVERSRDKLRLTQLTDAARQLGAESGMTATQGQARCPALRIVTRALPAEQAAQEILLQWAASISPRIEATGDGLCTIDLTGTRFDHEPKPLGDRCVEAFARMNLLAQVGIAANPELALLAAKFAEVSASADSSDTLPLCIIEPTAAATRRFVAPLPIHALSTPPGLVAVLHKWGLRTLGELAALPKEAAIERLGPEALPLWRQLSGGEPRPLQLHRPSELLTEAMDFEHHVEQLDALLFVLNRFLHSLEARLAELYLVAESLTLELRFEDGARHERAFRIPEPTRDIDLLLRTLHTHLENFRADVAVVGVRLTATPARQPQQQLDLFQPSLRDPNRFAETLSRLEALLGTGRVGSPEVLPTHRPDAFKVTSFTPERETGLPDELKRSVHFGPALRRFRPPLPATIELRRALDAETLLRISAGAVQGKIRASRGPWLASGDWWDRQPWQRREWDIELEDGGLYRLAQQDGQWQLDGEYD